MMSQREPVSNGFEYIRPELYPKQKAALFSKAKLVVTLGSTKSGKSISHLIWLFEQAAKYSKKIRQGIFWWVSPSYSQSKIMFRRLKGFLPPEIYQASETELKISLLHNDTVIWFKSAEDVDKLYGEDVQGIVVDEASRCKEAIYTLAQSVTTATDGMIRMIGNVKGRNWFYKLYERIKAEKMHPNWRGVNLTVMDAVEAGVLKQETIDLIKKSLPENVFNELYLNIPNDDGSNPFTIEAINACYGEIENPGPIARYGIDLAKKRDWTVIVGLDDNNQVVYFDRFQLDWELTLNRIRLLDNVPMIIDSTGVGDPIVERLQTERSHVKGFTFTSRSKQQLMEGLAVSLQRKEIRFYEEHLLRELENFTYEYGPTGVRYGTHLTDDAVMALALALRLPARIDLWDLIAEAA